ncbi:MAG: metal-dependent hydrolase, partial [Verrucomicrobiota bacterium]
MSSIIGHALMGSTAFALSKRRSKSAPFLNGFWLLSLLVAATAPDLDHLIPPLSPSKHNGLRITHSAPLVLCLSLLLSLPWLVLTGVSRETAKRALWLSATSFSHLILDYLVGAMPRPLLWPFTTDTYTSPVGILPSAGALQWNNFYLYR